MTEPCGEAVLRPDVATDRWWLMVSADEAGDPVLEIWHGERKVTLYTGGQGHAIAVWGPNVEREMAEVWPDLRGRQNFRAAYGWLRDGVTPEPPQLAAAPLSHTAVPDEQAPEA